MHFEFTSDNGLQTIAEKSTNLYLYDWKTETWVWEQLKANNWSKNTWPRWVAIQARDTLM